MEKRKIIIDIENVSFRNNEEFRSYIIDVLDEWCQRINSDDYLFHELKYRRMGILTIDTAIKYFRIEAA